MENLDDGHKEINPELRIGDLDTGQKGLDSVYYARLYLQSSDFPVGVEPGTKQFLNLDHYYLLTQSQLIAIWRTSKDTTEHVLIIEYTYVVRNGLEPDPQPLNCVGYIPKAVYRASYIGQKVKMQPNSDTIKRSNGHKRSYKKTHRK